MSPFQSRCTNSFHSISQQFSCDGQVAPEMLCTEPWLSPLGKQCCLCCCWGREGPVTLPRGIFPLHPAQGCSQIPLAADFAQHGYVQLKLLCSWVASASMKGLSWYKRDLSDPHVAFLPTKDLGAGWTGFPAFICLGRCSGKSCSFGLWALMAGELSFPFCPGQTHTQSSQHCRRAGLSLLPCLHTHPELPVQPLRTQPSPMGPDLRGDTCIQHKPLSLPYTPQG